MPIEQYTCTVCGQTFSDEASLRDHMVKQHATKEVTSEEGEEK